MLRRFLSLIAVLALLLLPLSLAGAQEDHNCSDFRSQQEAQQYFDSHGYSATNDPERLDADNDGIACEQLGSGTYEDHMPVTAPAVPSGMGNTGGGGMVSGEAQPPIAPIAGLLLAASLLALGVRVARR
ncbi:Excalibur domain protein [Thermobaculum terrenum ATCC BAA-798]|uniref:Excalibur domain protein n=1 Tax=Thermobaculum terrenum (strain ATCC BAA-798 / CCMEE 7001 / YNP1) TaxID=525904 RepID=D1CHK9_THET1|nr:excalibur calcium-binding domain-containing protein [Thermobaculum terrenum]ACZ43230.1 Excalibur domain protein [Thermobaculum terrenum ATCC BAA-798]